MPGRSKLSEPDHIPQKKSLLEPPVGGASTNIVVTQLEAFTGLIAPTAPQGAHSARRGLRAAVQRLQLEAQDQVAQGLETDDTVYNIDEVQPLRDYIKTLTLAASKPASQPRRKLSGARRRSRAEFLAQMRLAIAHIDVANDITSTCKLVVCSERIPQVQLATDLPAFFDSRGQYPAYGRTRCLVPYCFYCGGNTAKQNAQARRVGEADGDDDAYRFITFVLGSASADWLVEDVHRQLSEVVTELNAMKLWSSAFSASFNCIEPFGDESVLYGHVHSLVLVADDLALESLVKEFEARTGGYVLVESLRETPLRAALYIAKGFKPRKKQQPHLTASDDNLRSLVRLSRKHGTRWVWSTGTWAPGKLKSAEQSLSDAPRQRSRLAGHRRPPRKEFRTPTAARELLHRRLRPAESRFDGLGRRLERDALVHAKPRAAQLSTVVSKAVAPLVEAEDDGPMAARRALRASRSVVVKATAGAGKTSLLLDVLPKDRKSRVLVVSFNQHVVAELREKVPKGITVDTLHALGRSALARHTASINIVDDKVRRLTRALLPAASVTTVNDVVSLVTMAKAHGLRPEADGWPDAPPDILEVAMRVLLANNRKRSVVDFDDHRYDVGDLGISGGLLGAKLLHVEHRQREVHTVSGLTRLTQFVTQPSNLSCQFLDVTWLYRRRE